MISVLLKLIYRFKTISTKIPTDTYIEIDKMILEIHIEMKGTQIGKSNLRKKNGKLKLLDFMMYYKATVINLVWYWQKDRTEICGIVEFTQEKQRTVFSSKEGICPYKDLHTNVHSNSIQIVPNCKQPKYLSTDERKNKSCNRTYNRTLLRKEKQQPIDKCKNMMALKYLC